MKSLLHPALLILLCTILCGCPYDSLNIALAPVVTVGTKPYFNTLYQNSNIGAEYCDNGLAGTGTFRLDSPTVACWAGYIPAAQFKATRRNECDGKDRDERRRCEDNDDNDDNDDRDNGGDRNDR